MESSPPSQGFVPLKLDNTIGAAFVGVIVASLLLGVSLLQTWYYFATQNDRPAVRILVAAVTVFDIVHQALISHAVYTYSITNFNNPAALSNLVWSLLVEVLFNGFTAFLVQSFLMLRVWHLSGRNVWITGFVATLVLGEFACVLAFVGQSINFKTYAELATLKPLSISVNALAAAGDLFIAVTLCALLHRSRTGFSRSNTMINKLIMFAVNTGFLTSLCAIASLISIVVAGNTFLYIAFFFCLGRLYSNSLLATLNARRMIRGASDGIQSTSEAHSLSPRTDRSRSFCGSFGGAKRGPHFSFGPRSAPQTSISIKIDTTKEFASDARDDDGVAQLDGRFAREIGKGVDDEGFADSVSGKIDIGRDGVDDKECTLGVLECFEEKIGSGVAMDSNENST
ncbi:hypothetical protein HGRIS_005241 [Hohenbuehelia grisea]|uniref:DUF6534 domain-containing protein n=1 Tax=Hohenbuehelia grisea TaxID=104357 RepID=A0ABR3JEE0_9AGAR